MGAWGPAIFSDATACDIRSDYRELLEDGVEDAEATRRVVGEYQYLDADEAHVLWLALAAVQASLGRLDETTNSQALRSLEPPWSTCLPSEPIDRSGKDHAVPKRAWRESRQVARLRAMHQQHHRRERPEGRPW